MSSRSKGASYEREFESILKKLGYTTQRVKGSSIFNKNVDFFGCWDILAFNSHEWLLVQVKTQYRPNIERSLREWFDKESPPNTGCIYAIRDKGRRAGDRWELVYIGQNGTNAILPIKVKVSKSQIPKDNYNKNTYCPLIKAKLGIPNPLVDPDIIANGKKEKSNPLVDEDIIDNGRKRGTI